MATLSRGEQYWCDHQPWLLSLGYQLRPRYRPGWVASWITHPVEDILERDKREDNLRHSGLNPIMDAVRLVDNKPVMLKKIHSSERYINDEHIVTQYISSPDQIRNPDNHCVPIIEILRIPRNDNSVMLVMPLLRDWTLPRFDTIGEALDMIHQAFQGLQYLHRNHIVHRDCTAFNFMMDGSEMYPAGWHPIEPDYNQQYTGSAVQRYARTQRPPRYYWIDFGLSVLFHESDKCPRAIPSHAGDKSAPEYRHLYVTPGPREPNDPFPTDIYYLGNMIRMYFTQGAPNDRDLQGNFGFQFLEPLVQVMVQDDPTNRPTIHECVIQLEEIINSRSSWTLRSQVWHRADNPIGFVYRFFPHWARRVVYIITQTPAIPSRSRQPSPYLPLYTRVLLVLWVVMPLIVWLYPSS